MVFPIVQSKKMFPPFSGETGKSLFQNMTKACNLLFLLSLVKACFEKVVRQLSFRGDGGKGVFFLWVWVWSWVFVFVFVWWWGRGGGGGGGIIQTF